MSRNGLQICVLRPSINHHVVNLSRSDRLQLPLDSFTEYAPIATSQNQYIFGSVAFCVAALAGTDMLWVTLCRLDIPSKNDNNV